MLKRRQSEPWNDKEEDLIFAKDQNRPARRGGGRYNNNYNIQNNNDYYGGDFRLKVDFPSFYGNLADFMRLAERNDLRDSEVHQVIRYLDAIKSELMIRDRGGSRIGGNRRTYGNDNFQRSTGEETSRSFTDRRKAAQRWNQGTERKKDKGPGKKVVELKKGQKTATNPYAKPILGKCYHCGQPDHRSNKFLLENLLM
ncbi:hypothetical protein M9H77_06391 [Catharanthus roseus]|uniref:Uncharacterized protein n=1 Tax=Catharanthus roseus TaxID=4058 RepID=A0ACC0BS10_CATRO|nr:hypothetical protein M9H77_06391 [Catharanthus roseus]